MKITIKDIQKPIDKEMKDFEQKFRQSMRSNVLLLDKIMTYIVKRKGKQLRPMFVFLSAGIAGEINESTHRGAALIELLHTATLVHDDVVDEAEYRRGFFSINALWKNKVAVLAGDYLLSRGLLLAIDNDDYSLLRIVSNAVREMSEGELLQMEKARSLDITEAVYFEVIEQKTASLIASCCAVGAASAGVEQERVDTFKEFGVKIGMAFQIKDDLFDYGTKKIGKPVGIDIREKKLTLPLIYALSQATKSKKREILRLIRKDKLRSKSIKEVVAFVNEMGGIAYAAGIMKKYYNDAIAILDSFPESDYKSSMKMLLQFTIEREL